MYKLDSFSDFDKSNKKVNESSVEYLSSHLNTYGISDNDIAIILENIKRNSYVGGVMCGVTVSSQYRVWLDFVLEPRFGNPIISNTMTMSNIMAYFNSKRVEQNLIFDIFNVGVEDFRRGVKDTKMQNTVWWNMTDQLNAIK